MNWSSVGRIFESPLKLSLGFLIAGCALWGTEALGFEGQLSRLLAFLMTSLIAWLAWYFRARLSFQIHKQTAAASLVSLASYFGENLLGYSIALVMLAAVIWLAFFDRSQDSPPPQDLDADSQNNPRRP